MNRFSLIVITPPETLAKETVFATRMFEAGLKILHVRKPDAGKTELEDYIHSIPKKYHKRLVIHSYYGLLKQFDLKGIHLTERTRIKKLPASFKKTKHSLSASFHSLSDLSKTKRKYDYVFLSPVFDSISKTGYRSNFDFAELELFLKKHKNVFALGGIEPATVRQIKEMGFAGGAVLGYIWKSKDPVKAFEKLLHKIE